MAPGPERGGAVQTASIPSVKTSCGALCCPGPRLVLATLWCREGGAILNPMDLCHPMSLPICNPAAAGRCALLWHPHPVPAATQLQLHASASSWPGPCVLPSQGPCHMPHSALPVKYAGAQNCLGVWRGHPAWEGWEAWPLHMVSLSPAGRKHYSTHRAREAGPGS